MRLVLPVFFVVLVLGLAQGHNFSSALFMNIKNAGFHRDIIYSLKFSHNADQKCEMMLLQTLPASVFVNTDELLGLKKLGKIKTFVPVYVDVELPTSKAHPFPVYIFSHIQSEVNISMPIHFRYHLPGDKKFERVSISSPQLFVFCDGQHVDVNAVGRQKLPCSSSNLIMDYDRLEEAVLCSWDEVELINSPTTISVMIPIGSNSPTKLTQVMIITFGCSWLGCMYLIYIIIKKSKYLNKKML